MTGFSPTDISRLYRATRFSLMYCRSHVRIQRYKRAIITHVINILAALRMKTTSYSLTVELTP